VAEAPGPSISENRLERGQAELDEVPREFAFEPGLPRL